MGACGEGTTAGGGANPSICVDEDDNEAAEGSKIVK